jgi:hypothetical protein
MANSQGNGLHRMVVQTIKADSVDQLMIESPQFKTCSQGIADMNKMTPEEINAFKACFNEQLNQIDDPKQLEKMSEQLELKKFGLVPSNDRKNLTEYFSKRLQKYLYNKTLSGTKLKDLGMVNHQEFHDIYKSIVSRHIINEYSRFCLEDYERPAGVSRSKHADNQLEQLKQDVRSGTEKPFKAHFIACHEKIAQNRGRPCKNYYDKIEGKDFGDSREDQETRDYRRACMMQNKLRAYKVVVRKLKEDDKFYKDLAANSKVRFQSLYELNNQIAGNSLKKKKSPQEFAIMTSQELLKEAYQQNEDKKYLDDQLSAFQKECITRYTNDCANHLDQDEANALKKLKVKMEAEVNVKIKLLDKADEQQLKKMVENDHTLSFKEKKLDNPDEIREMIKKKYLAEKNALIVELQDRINKRTIDNADASNPPDLSHLNEDLSAKKSAIEAASLYSNIIISNGAFTLTDADGNEQIHTRSLEREQEQLGQEPSHAWINDIQIDNPRTPSNTGSTNESTLDISENNLNKLVTGEDQTEEGENANSQTETAVD